MSDSLRIDFFVLLRAHFAQFAKRQAFLEK
jgi:hypothetical protein